jgi:hypothetical protein
MIASMDNTHPTPPRQTAWFKSSRSTNANACVEVRFSDKTVYVRDSKELGAGPIIAMSAVQWAGFLADAATRPPA